MKKAMRVTMKRVQTIFVRRKSKDARNENSTSDPRQNEGCGSIPVENGLEASEVQDSTEPSPEPLEILLSSDEEDNSHFRFPDNDVRHRKMRVQVAQNKTSKRNTESSEHQGACGPIVPTIQILDDSKSALVPVNGDGQVVVKNMFPSDVLRSCGSLEKECFNFPLELQEKIFGIKENLLWRYPPHYDFCVIASDDDYGEAIQFKNYVAATFGLAGCVLDDGFRVLGAELFDCYKSMMDHSSKVFFFVTDNFNSDAFCKRLQSGAVFLSLMSKAKKDKEKCVPVFPHGYPKRDNIPMALLGIAGLNTTQSDTTDRILANTYSCQLRQRRYVLDLQNFKKRCLEFEVQVQKCIEEYKTNSIQNNLSVMSLAENDHLIDQTNSPVLEALPPVIQLLENENTEIQTVENHSIETCTDLRAPTIGKKDEEREQEKMRKELSDSQKYKCIKNPQNGKTGSKDHDISSDNEIDHSGLDEVLKNLPDDGHESVNNSVSTVNITDTASVHVGNVYNITINQASPSVFSHLEQNIKSYTTAFCDKGTSERHSDSD